MAGRSETGDTIEMSAPRPTPTAFWWEEEGKKRRDSVWMGTDGSGERKKPNSKAGKTSRNVSVGWNVNWGGLDGLDEGGKEQMEEKKEDSPTLHGSD